MLSVICFLVAVTLTAVQKHVDVGNVFLGLFSAFFILFGVFAFTNPLSCLNNDNRVGNYAEVDADFKYAQQTNDRQERDEAKAHAQSTKQSADDAMAQAKRKMKNMAGPW
jgi:hypothetical protein